MASDDETDSIKDFIVQDEPEKVITIHDGETESVILRKIENIEDEDFESEDDVSTEDESEESDEEEEEEDLPSDTEENAKHLVEIIRKEAEPLISSLNTTVIGGRTLRNREAIKPAKDVYWETYGKKEFETLLAKEDKKERIATIKQWKKEFAESHPEVEYKQFTKQSTHEEVIEEYKRLAHLFDIPSSDDEDSSEASVDSDDSEGEDESEEEEDEDDDEEDESEEDDEEESDEERSAKKQKL